MAGYKSTILSERPLCFLTFDGDRYHENTRKIKGTTSIIDETGNCNATLVDASPTSFGYRMGTQSLCEIEQFDNKSICFGYYGSDSSIPELYPKSYIEMPDVTSDLQVFSIELFFNKESEITESNFKLSPIIRGTVYYLCFHDSIADSSLSFYHQGKRYAIKNFTRNENHHLVITCKYFTVRIFLDGYEYLDGNDFFEVSLDNGTKESYPPFRRIIEIGAISNLSGIHGVNTGRLFIDQISFWNKELSPSEIMHHYKKCQSYDSMIMKSNPDNFWKFSESATTSDPTIYPSAGVLKGQYVGNRFNISREEEGPDKFQIVSNNISPKNMGVCVHFISGAHAKFSTFAKGICVDRTEPFRKNIGTNYAIEFWGKFSHRSDVGIILSMSSDSYPFNGWHLMMNTKNQMPATGFIEFSESKYENSIVVTTKEGNHNNGTWRHYLIQRVDNNIEFYVDSILQGSVSDPVKKTVSHPGQLFLMNMAPGDRYVDGYIFCLAIYSRFLQKQEIDIRNTFSVIYVIQGIITLMGIPKRALVRFYRNSDGEFISETWSDINDGTYEMRFPDNNLIDIVVFDPNDTSLIYRTFGPVKPHEVPDPFDI